MLMKTKTRTRPRMTRLLVLSALALGSLTPAFGFQQICVRLIPSSEMPRRQRRKRQVLPQSSDSSPTATQLDAVFSSVLMDAVTASSSLVLSSSSSSAAAAAGGLLADGGGRLPTSAEPIHTAFAVATFLPQPFWLLMILFPRASITKKIMGGLEVPLLCCLLHLFIVLASLNTDNATAPLADFENVFDPGGDPQRAFMKMVRYPNFVAEEWSHVLTWDLFVGRYVWWDGLRRNIFTAPAVLFCNLIGPPGLLLHWIGCALSGQPIVDPLDQRELDEL